MSSIIHRTAALRWGGLELVGGLVPTSGLTPFLGLDVDQEVPEMEVKGPMNNMVRAFFHRCAGRSVPSLSTGPAYA